MEKLDITSSQSPKYRFNLLTDKHPYVTMTFFSFGVYFLGSKGFHFIKAFSSKNIFSKNIYSSLKQRYGSNSWVVITGATDGIGKEFALNFAKNNFNLVLVARNPDKLKSVAEEINILNTEIKTKQALIDFNTVENTLAYNKYYEEVKDLDISMLINNAGVTYTNWHHDLTIDQIREIINVNCLSTALMSNKTIPLLRKRSCRSAIINTSSFVGVHPAPFLATYSGSKAFVDAFSTSLYLENNDKIDVISMKPYYVSTKMTKYQKVKYDTISVEDYVDSCIREIGRNSSSFGHYKHKLMDLWYRCLPRRFLEKMRYTQMKKVVDQLKKIEELRSRRKKDKR